MKKILLSVLLLLIVAGCDTTSKLGDGEVLYTGVR